MRRNHIAPNNATAAEKRLIQQKLAANTKLAVENENEGDNDEFFDIRKEAMITKMAEMGMDRDQVAAFIEDRGMFEENPELIIDNLDNPRYVNSLRLKYQQENNVKPVNLVYDFDPVPGQSKQKYMGPPQGQQPLLLQQQ